MTVTFGHADFLDVLAQPDGPSPERLPRKILSQEKPLQLLQSKKMSTKKVIHLLNTAHYTVRKVARINVRLHHASSSGQKGPGTRGVDSTKGK